MGGLAIPYAHVIGNMKENKERGHRRENTKVNNRTQSRTLYNNYIDCGNFPGRFGILLCDYILRLACAWFHKHS